MRGFFFFWRSRPMNPDLSKLENIIGYSFGSKALLDRALTHSSAANERHSACGNNQQLEFLGDSVIGFLISDYLYQKFHHLSEGELSKLRAHLVSSANFFKIASRLELGEFLHLGKGEEKTGGRKKPTLLVDAFEALVGAIYLDGGLDAARSLVLNSFRTDFQAIEAGYFHHVDFKSQLQERLQALRFPPAEYAVVASSGPDHKKQFSVELKIRGKKLSEGHGDTKKGAEQEAARLALNSVLS
jgi:ribonuclease-3